MNWQKATICYLCEQSAKKLLKGFLVPYIEDVPRTHDLMKLCRLCEKQDADFAELFEQCARLMPYGIQVRYPNNAELYEEDMQMALKDLTKMIEMIQPKLQQKIAEIEASETQIMS